MFWVTKGFCPACGSECDVERDFDTSSVFYPCPVCGRFQLTYTGQTLAKDSRLASFLYHNRFVADGYYEYRYHTTLDKEKCDEYSKQFDAGNNTHGRPVHMDAAIIENWYPKTFADRVDAILLCLNEKAKHIGSSVILSTAEALSLLFIDRKEKCEDVTSPDYGKTIDRSEDSCDDEAHYILNYLSDSQLIQYHEFPSDDESYEIIIAPQGYSRIDHLLKNTSNGRNALVAMKFGDDTKPLRESIRQGISDAGYNAIFIDEVQHNDFITPELLKYIRDSKFVVVDLTHQNNGAYFEEGYAMGLGKPVIQLCKKDTKLHFDIAQKNTIIWASEDEIPVRLTNRIKATID